MGTNHDGFHQGVHKECWICITTIVVINDSSKNIQHIIINVVIHEYLGKNIYNAHNHMVTCF